jgi:hypothetical protein
LYHRLYAVELVVMSRDMKVIAVVKQRCRDIVKKHIRAKLHEIVN